ncbi:hypothetical protein Mal15_51330 [Stieleria maiorica]|uniref:Uncharacterized protein n=1 Tax=Stieleria maiorica TaxID=2795974 RepID=A0A5B9MMB6_9BACT|nr:hypothetical protein Mal15_51330 [Stieleria maiorica]
MGGGKTMGAKRWGQNDGGKTMGAKRWGQNDGRQNDGRQNDGALQLLPGCWSKGFPVKK